MLNRRAFLLSGLALYGATARELLAGSALQSPSFPGSPFTLGVASGDPAPDGFVLWTRLAPDPLNGGGMAPLPVEVEWLVFSDDRMTRVVKTGRAVARPEWGHSVHVEVSGLEPHRWYWYRFRAGNELSPIGRARTFPAARAGVDRLRFAFASCQNYEHGLYTAYEHMANEDLDFVLHLGDYIYESAGVSGRARRHLGGELMTLDDYRNRYALYRSDPALQAVHASFPWIVVWDDHEVDNDYAGLLPQGGESIETFAVRRAAAYRAYYEHMPLRRTSVPRGALLQLYRPFHYGTLASIFMLDTRQYRASATLLGAGQEKWLLDELDRSPAGWNLLAQQVMIARLDRAAGPEQRFSMDMWDGYEASRNRLMKFLGTRRPKNPVTLAGDVHNNWVNDLRLDFNDPKSPIVATEFVGTSITSNGDGSDMSGSLQVALAENECVRFANDQRGYVACEIRPSQMRTDFKVVDYVTRPGAPIKTRATFVVDDGRAGAHSQ